MERLGDDEQKHFAESILGWILRAKRLLKMRELQEALAVESDDTELNRSLINPPASILHACGGLIDHDASTDIVKFSHETVREYVEGAKFEHLTSHSMIAETCLTYLSFDAICGPCQDFQSLEKRMAEYTFGEYAAHFWGEHAYAVCKTTMLMTQFLRHSRRRTCATRCIRWPITLTNIYIDNLPSKSITSALSVDAWTINYVRKSFGNVDYVY